MCIIDNVLCDTGGKIMQVANASNAYRLAYETIRTQIVTGELTGGTKLIEERLAEKIGVSRTPVREAIRRLEQEGLIQEKRVYKPTIADIIHSSEFRTLIECYAIKKAANNMSEENLRHLKQAVLDSKTGSVEEIVSANNRFHSLIIAESNNPIMIQEAKKMDAIFYLFSRTLIINKRPLLYEEHVQIYKAIEMRKPELASRLMKEHIECDLQFMLRYNGKYK